MIDEKKITVELSVHGYSSNEIQGVIEGIKDVEAGRTYTAEEVYEHLFKEEKVYA